MKKLSLIIALIALTINGFAQSKPVTMRPLKTDDQYFPRWAFDLTYKFGSLSQDITMYDLGQFYDQSIASKNLFSKPKFTEGQSHGISAGIGYFFGEKRRWGVGTGLSFFMQKGVMTMDDFHTEYRSVDNNNDTFRQILNNFGAVEEKLTMYNLTMPFLLKFKHQWNGQKWGVAIDAGPFLGLHNSNSTSGKGIFNYEAAYKYNGQNAVYDNGATLDPNDEIITRAFWVAHPTTDATVQDYFGRKYTEGMNVALDHQLDKNNTTSYNSLSYGFTVQPSLTYQLSYKSSLLLGMYFNQQYFQNKDVSSYHLTDKVGEYNSMTSGVKTSVATSWGVNVGVRIFFGEKADRDGDNVADADDKCPLVWGDVKVHGCPDRDGDGVIDEMDECPDVAGPAYARGCPDRDGDGIADKDDKCPDVAGEYSGCPVEKIADRFGYTKVQKVEVKDPLENYFDILQTSVINFNSGKSNLLDSSIVALDNAVDALNKDTKTIIYVSGHADSLGSYATNMRLSFARAQVVRDYFVKKGISPERILIAGYGKETPLVNNKTAANRARNRRTELKLLLPLKKK